MSTKRVNNKIVKNLTYIYIDIDTYIQIDENTERIIETFCANTNKMYSRLASIDILTNEFIVEYVIMEL